MSVNIVVADDHALVRESLRRVIESQPDLHVVAEAADGDEAVRTIEREGPDVALLDVRMPGRDGLEVLEIVRRRRPDTKVVMLSAEGDSAVVQRALEQGASAYIVKSVKTADVPAVIRQAVGAASVFFAAQQAPARKADGEEDPSLADLTNREREILRAVAEGMSTKAISRDQWVTEKTVKFHLTNIYRKLGVPNRTSAARMAYERGLLERV